MALIPLNLFVAHRGQSSRQRITCRYRCADACFHPASNTSDNEYFRDIVRRAGAQRPGEENRDAGVSRRSVLQGAAVTVLAVSAGSALAACSPTWPPSPATRSASPAPNTP